ncbi:response regulator [Sporolactobacillus terrae]|uniref:DNA-binding response regulator n=1 Tax=Sporolactobacillus terrae TaxID=269673 RepID=A0A410D7Q1_9BACL|nr:response regulator transcription factor [Sporolactobacillus terrae]QAA22140.1 DNA-binding response regulator [Sporolactobacillus terrae]QAA25112.1 DNA-binding response regulator [Sporolactobacillus terrae]BBN98440.1 DNA-binding response regulator [Sporolactobacillus terrae]
MNVIIVDDDRLVVSSLNTILETDPEIRVVGSGYSGAEALHLCQRLCPDLLLIDIRMDGLSGIEAAKRLMNQAPKTKVLFLTTFSDDEYIIEALRIGAKGYILKQNFESIIPALKAVFSGQRVFGDAIIDKIPSLMKSNEQPNLSDYHFSSRELAMIRLVADGKSNREIAQELYLSEGTVRNYISSILDKLALRDRTQLAVFYYKQS